MRNIISWPVVLFSSLLLSCSGLLLGQQYKKQKVDNNDSLATAKPDTMQLLLNQYTRTQHSADSLEDLIDLENAKLKKLNNYLNQLNVVGNSAVEQLNEFHLMYNSEWLPEKLSDSLDIRNKEFSETANRRYQEINRLVDNRLEQRKKEISLEIQRLIKLRQDWEPQIDKAIKQTQGVSNAFIGAKKITVNGVEFLCYVADLQKENIQLHWDNPQTKIKYGNLGALKTKLDRDSLQVEMICNAGMYKPNHEPQGVFIESQGLVRFPLDKRDPNDENFYLMPNGVFYIDTLNHAYIDTTLAFENLCKKNPSLIKLATQSGPQLLINNRIHPAFTRGSTNRLIRNGVGVISDNRVVFIIALRPVSFYDFSLVFKQFNCKNALFLDGNVSRMYQRTLQPNSLDGDLGPLLSVTKIKKK